VLTRLTCSFKQPRPNKDTLSSLPLNKAMASLPRNKATASLPRSKAMAVVATEVRACGQ
jgi:hypothetical protein